MSAGMGYVVVTWWQRKGEPTRGEYLYEPFDDVSEAIDLHAEYERDEFERARAVGIFEARHGMPTGVRVSPSTGRAVSSQQLAEQLRAYADVGLEVPS